MWSWCTTLYQDCITDAPKTLWASPWHPWCPCHPRRQRLLSLAARRPIFHSTWQVRHQRWSGMPSSTKSYISEVIEAIYHWCPNCRHVSMLKIVCWYFGVRSVSSRIHFVGCSKHFKRGSHERDINWIFLQDFTPGPQNTPAKNDQRLMFYCSIYFINRFTMICYVLPYFTSFSPYFTNGLTFCWHHQLSSAGPPRRFRHPQHRWPPFWWQSWARRESCALHRLWGGKWWNIGYHMDAIWHMIYLGIGIHISHVPSFDMAYGIHLMIFDDIWCYLMLFDDIWWYLKIFDDIWYRMI